MVTEEAKPTRSGSPLANTLLGFDGAAARPAAERVCCARAPRPPADDEGAPPEAEQEDDDDDAELALLREQLKATVRALAQRKREEAEAAATPFLAAVFEDATFAPPATPPTSPPGLVAPEAARWKSTSALGATTSAAAARDRAVRQTRKPPMAAARPRSAKKQRGRRSETLVRRRRGRARGLPPAELLRGDDDGRPGRRRGRARAGRARTSSWSRCARGGCSGAAMGSRPSARRTLRAGGLWRSDTGGGVQRRTTSPCWREEMTFDARGATTVKLLFYSRNTYMADSLLGGCVVDLGARRVRARRAAALLVEVSWFSVEPERRPTGPEDFLYRHRNALGSVGVWPRLPGHPKSQSHW